MPMDMSVKPVGVINSLFKFKNGTPRQPTLCPFARGTLTIEKSVFNNPQHSLEGLENYSHVWLIFIFHKNNNDYVKAKVRPPRLNGKRVGLFSTRSPYRPNPIGLTLAKLDKVEGDTLHLSGIDLLDGTPVIDVKPFIPEYDIPQKDTSDSVAFDSCNITSNQDDGMEVVEKYDIDTNIDKRDIQPLNTDVHHEKSRSSTPYPGKRMSNQVIRDLRNITNDNKVNMKDAQGKIDKREVTCTMTDTDNVKTENTSECDGKLKTRETTGDTAGYSYENRTREIPKISSNGGKCETLVEQIESGCKMKIENGSVSEGATLCNSETEFLGNKESDKHNKNTCSNDSIDVCCGSTDKISCTGSVKSELSSCLNIMHNSRSINLPSQNKAIDQTADTKILKKDDNSPIVEISPEQLFKSPDIHNIPPDTCPENNGLFTAETNYQSAANKNVDTALKTADWINSPPVSKLAVQFTSNAENQLSRFSYLSADPGYKLQFLHSLEEARNAICSILREDPRSVYRRKHCQDNLYYFAVDVLHVTCWFDQDIAEVVRIKPVSLVSHCQRK